MKRPTIQCRWYAVHIPNGKILYAQLTLLKVAQLSRANSVYGPYKTKDDAMRDNKVKKNPPSHAPVEIYDRILEIRAKKGKKSLWPGQLFKHEFKDKSQAKIFGNPDGSITIRSVNGTPLWKKFDY